MQFDLDPSHWTMYYPPYLQTNVDLPNHPIPGAKGLRARLSQELCQQNPRACCSGSRCAFWAGAHLSTPSCFKFGVFEWESSQYYSSDNAARFFFALFEMGTSPYDSDTTWNEIDVGFGAAPGVPAYFSAAYFNPNLTMKRFSSTTRLAFDAAFAQGWHTYQLRWTPTSLTYLIDGVVYWTQANSSTITVPWRCLSYRFILRTDGGLSTPAGDDFVYLRRFKYTTLATY